MAITPDEKDWTWVLERPCPECGFSPREVTTETIPAELAARVTQWQRVLHGRGLTMRPVPDKWSTLEYGCHVRDVLRLADERLSLMLDDDGTHFENWDQDATALADGYHLQDPEVVATELTLIGEALVRRYSQVAGEQWDHRGFRSNGSEFTVATFGVYVIHDVVHHLWDVEDERNTP